MFESMAVILARRFCVSRTMASFSERWFCVFEAKADFTEMVYCVLMIFFRSINFLFQSFCRNIILL